MPISVCLRRGDQHPSRSFPGDLWKPVQASIEQAQAESAKQEQNADYTQQRLVQKAK
jgi:hypothetical protein